MKRSQRMARLHRINQLQEKLAASNFASVRERHEQLEQQLDRLRDYWNEYSTRLEELKKTTSSARELREHLQFLGKLDEAIRQQQEALAKSAAQLHNAEAEFLERRVDTRKIEKATASMRRQELVSEQQQIQKEMDDIYAAFFP